VPWAGRVRLVVCAVGTGLVVVPAELVLGGAAVRVNLHTALRAKGVDSTRYVVKGGNHGDLTFVDGDPNASKQWSSRQVVGNIVSLLNKHLG
jgi:hypothetical protein